VREHTANHVLPQVVTLYEHNGIMQRAIEELRVNGVQKAELLVAGSFLLAGLFILVAALIS
jgi:hypothetical protein